MIGDGGLLTDIRRIAGQEASIPALRACLSLFAMCAGLAWYRRWPRLALLSVVMGGGLGLGYWLVQIVAPLGLGTDAALTRQWAQAGVNSGAEPGDIGFVIGTPGERSLLSELARVGMPPGLIQMTPQVASVICLGLQLVLPFVLIRNRTTAAFAASLAVSGGLWPGLSTSPAALRLSSNFGGAALVLGLLLAVLSRDHRTGTRRLRRRVGVAGGVVATAGLVRAWEGGAEAGITAALLMVMASVLLASPLRGLLRKVSSAAFPRHLAEALILTAAFAGGGLFWWNPVLSTPGFAESTDENQALRRTMDWIRRNVPPGGIVLCSPEYSTTVAALAARRVLLSPPTEEGVSPLPPEPFRRSRLFVSTMEGRPIARLAEAFSVTHLFLGPGEATPPAGVDREADTETRLRLVPVYEDSEGFRVFLLARK